MSGRAFRSRTLPVGLYLGQRGIFVAQVTHDGRSGWRWSALYGRDYPESRADLMASPKAFRNFINETFREARCRGRNVISALPVNDLKIFSTRYTVPTGQDETQCLLRHLKERLREDLSRSVIDWLPIREAHDKSGETKSALVAVAYRDQVNAYLDLLVSAGCNPLALDIGPAALARLVRTSIPADKAYDVLLINFGRETTFLSMLWGRRLMLDRGVHFGETALIERIAQAFDLSDEEALRTFQRYGIDAREEMGAAIGEILHSALSELVREISRVLVYFASQTHGGAVSEIRILGALAECPGIADWLAKSLEAPVSLLDPLLVMNLQRENKPSSSIFERTGLAVAGGLALRGQV